MLREFYATTAQASLTLLGLWWVIVQLRYAEWMRDVRLRRTVYDVSLYFLLPGMMSLGSLLATESTTVWRVSFVLAALVGAGESVLSIVTVRAPDTRGRLLRVGDWISIVIYVGIAGVAIWRTLPQELGIELTPLEVEGILVTLLLLMGVALAAAMFVVTQPPPAERRPGSDARGV